ncbi:uncharacterized protein MKK02DRAFT_38641 [Dioszegia hungarica]|uniref:PCI domain-containing protein n=1 Tax=Dioszegia hungarica TaxID=4972 RepID=A0AA38H4W1_9TREE|nr:uncharacterized protein MKK02DRAFT_38641 [Dioszegia hungarica]KAI9633970.1 hypothetical protein MKK02DRAFT_38641 [Dioszegia hungarica]
MADYDHAARLEPFLLLARSTKGAAAAKVISDATAAPGVYIFGELLDLPGIRELANDANLAKSHQLLELFAYGNLHLYLSNKESFPPLSPAHLLKLQHLSLVSMALERRSIPYQDILSSLQLPSVRVLEDLIIDVMYSGLLAGKMQHHEAVLHIDWVAGRDIAERDLPLVQQRLEDWCSTAQNLLAALDERIAEVRSAAHHESASLADYKHFRNEQYRDIQKSSKETRNSSGRNFMKDGWSNERGGQRLDSAGTEGGGGPGGDAGGAGGGGSKGGIGGMLSRNVGTKVGPMSADDAFGKKARGAKRPRDL